MQRKDAVGIDATCVVAGEKIVFPFYVHAARDVSGVREQSKNFARPCGLLTRETFILI